VAVYRMTCFRCGLNVAGEIVASEPTLGDGHSIEWQAPERTFWLRCPNCREGSVKIKGGSVFPIAPTTTHVAELPDEVQRAWREAGLAHAVGAYTASEMTCRKILMHIGVDKAGSRTWPDPDS
jgi:hypothetical protein